MLWALLADAGPALAQQDQGACDRFREGVGVG